MGADRQKRKREEAVRPYLEPDERIRATMIGQTPVPPIIYLLVAPIVFIFIIQFKTIVVTDRNVYVFPNRWMRTYKFREDQIYKAPRAAAKVESGSMWVRVDEGPRIWTAPFGPVKKWRREVLEAAAQPAPAGEVGPGAAQPQPAVGGERSG